MDRCINKKKQSHFYVADGTPNNSLIENWMVVKLPSSFGQNYSS